jgi:CubicO group peptidase (beta-lactamase class C family)
MLYPAIIEKIEDTLKELPDQTELSFAVIRDGNIDHWGMIKEKGIIRSIDNHRSAFEIGSVTKAFTGHLLAQLVIEQKVDLDDLAQEYLPFPVLGNPTITLRHLAMHTSGLQRMPHDFESQSNYDKDNPFKHYSEEQLATYFTQNLRLDSLPGEKYQYSNLGSGLLSYMLSRIEGRPFAKLVAERIFEPLEMVNSSFDVCELRTLVVKGLDEQGNVCKHWDGGVLAGCLGIVSTAEDLSRFAVMTCDSSAAAANLQASESFAVDDLVRSNLGWSERLILPENIRMQGINGGTGGYGASLLVNRKDNCSVVILSNIWPRCYLELIYPIGKEILIKISKETTY